MEDAKTDAGTRSVFGPSWVAEEIKTWIDNHDLTGSDLLFDFGRRTIQKEHERAREAMDLPDYTIHSRCAPGAACAW